MMKLLNRLGLAFVAVFACIAMYTAGYRSGNSGMDILEANLAASQDSVRTLVLKDGERIKTIHSFVLEQEQLYNLLELNKKEIDDLNKQLKSKTAYIAKMNGSVKYDTIYVSDTVSRQGDMLTYTTKYDSRWLNLYMHTCILGNDATTTISDVQVPIPLTVGLAEDYSIWVKSDNPYVDFTDIKGAFLDQSKFIRETKPKRWSVGVQCGVGVQYNIIDKGMGVGPYVGVGIAYSLLNF